MSEPNEKTVYRLPPCPDYDVTGMESWLENLAEQGLFLSKDGFFCGVGFFTRGEPRRVQYRLQAVEKKKGFLSEEGEDPSEQMQEDSLALGWTYIARRGEFYIYRAEEDVPRELDTDPVVQAMAMKAVRKRLAWDGFVGIFWALWPLVYQRGAVLRGFLLASIEVNTLRMLFWLAVIVWFMVQSIRRLLHLKRMEKSLRETGTLPLCVKKRGARYFIRNAVEILLLVALCSSFLHLWLTNLDDRKKIPLDVFTGEVPFATMQDFTDGTYTCEPFMDIDGVEVRKDLLAPTYIQWIEFGKLRQTDGTVLSGNLYITYYRAANESIARELARELVNVDKFCKKDYRALETPAIAADFVTAYFTPIQPTVVLQKGSQVIKAGFLQHAGGEENAIPMQVWAGILADSLVEP